MSIYMDPSPPAPKVSNTDITPENHQLNTGTNKAVNRWRLSFPFMTFIVIAFYAQGRAYAEGYISYFGLSTSLFPVSLEDAYWYAFIGWAVVLGKAPEVLWNLYPQYLYNNFLPISMVVVLPLMVLIGKRYSWQVYLADRHRKIFSWINKKNSSSAPLVDGMKHMAWWSLFPAVLIAVLPLIFIYVTIILAIFILIFVLPFLNVGAGQARSDCVDAASNYSIVRYVNESAKGAIDNSILSARLLQCNSSFCILIREGFPLAIQQSTISVIEGKIGKKASSTDVPKEQQLCFIPPDAK